MLRLVISVRVSTAPALAFFPPAANLFFLALAVSRAFVWMVGFSGLFMWVPVFCVSACDLAFQFPQMSAGLIRAFINVRGNVRG